MGRSGAFDGAAASSAAPPCLASPAVEPNVWRPGELNAPQLRGKKKWRGKKRANRLTKALTIQENVVINLKTC